jgi:hypothetical protein
LAGDFKVEGKGVDSDELERELARRVEARTVSGAFSGEVEAMLAERLPAEEPAGGLEPLAQLDYAATRAASSWEVSTAYPVETEKSRALKPFIIFAKRLARIWARIAVGPIQREQTAFNRHAASGLDAVRRQAVAERLEALAMEQDLSDLAGALLAEGEAAASAGAITEFLAPAHKVLLVGPCPSPVLRSLEGPRLEVLRVSAGGPWETTDGQGAQPGAVPSFLSSVEECSRPAILLSELSFWLKPEALISLTRRSYLALAPRGRMAVSVSGFASATPAPAWCSGPVIKKALAMAGFIDIAVVRPAESGAYLATARKP